MVSRTETAFSSLSFPHKAGRGNPDRPKPLHRTFPLQLNSPFPSPEHKHVLLLHAPHTMSLANGLSSSSAASPPGPTGMVPPSAKLPHHRFLLSGLARPGRPCADGEGAATALPKGCFRSSAQCKGVRRLFLKQGPSPVPDLTLRSSAVNRRCGRGAKLPSHPGGPPISSRPRRQPAAILCAVAATQIQ